MRLSTLVFLVAMMTASAKALAAGPFGLGIVLGGPTGISASYQFNKERSIVGVLSIGPNFWGLQGDYLWHDRAYTPIDLYIGAGLGIFQYQGRYGYYRNGVVVYEGTDVGTYQLLRLRMPLGLAFTPRNIPLEPFVEATPSIYLAGDPYLFIDLALGLRFYF